MNNIILLIVKHSLVFEKTQVKHYSLANMPLHTLCLGLAKKTNNIKANRIINLEGSIIVAKIGALAPIEC